MNTTTLGQRPTRKMSSSVVRVSYQAPGAVKLPSQDTSYVRAVVAAIGQCNVHAGGWRRKDVLRGRPNPINGLFKLLRELKAYGAPLAELEGVSVALYNALRALITEGLTPVNESLADALVVEQEREGIENVATLAALQHPSVGTYRALRQATLNEIEASRHIVDLLDAELLRMEAAR